MKPAVSAALIASAVAAIGAAGLEAAFRADLPNGIKTLWGVSGFVLAAAITTFLLVHQICVRRAGKSPVLGAARGALAAMATLLVSIVLHALVLPGPLGRLGSLAGMTLIGTALFGLPVAVAGAITGHFIERVFFPARRHETSSP